MLHLPDGSTNALALVSRMGEHIGFWPDTLVPGTYRVQAAGVPDRAYAVTLPPDEALPDPLAVPARTVVAGTVPLQFASSLKELKEHIDREGGTTDLSDALLWLALLALAGELLLSRRFSG